MIAIDRFAYNNSLRSVHPGEKSAFSLISIMIVLLLDSPPVSLLVLAGVSCFLTLQVKVPWRFYLKLLLLPATFLLLGVLTTAFSWSAGQADFIYLWKLGGIRIGITAAGGYAAMKLFLKSLASVSCLYFLILTTPMVEMFALLNRWKFPAVFVELMSLVYRFLFVLLEVAGNMMTSQHSRWGYSSLRSGFRSLAGLVSGVLVRAYHKALLSYDAMEARCYQGEFLILDWNYELSWKNAAYIVIFECSLLLANYLPGVI